jgi:hypothetical protein
MIVLMDLNEYEEEENMSKWSFGRISKKTWNKKSVFINISSNQFDNSFTTARLSAVAF